MKQTLPQNILNAILCRMRVVKKVNKLEVDFCGNQLEIVISSLKVNLLEIKGIMTNFGIILFVLR